jgi:uncharacterized protein YchJ
MQRALQNQLAAQSGENSLAREAAQQLPSSILTVADVASIFSDALAAQKRDLVEHQARLHKLAQLQHTHEETRFANLNKRLFEVESQIRRLSKGRPR